VSESNRAGEHSAVDGLPWRLAFKGSVNRWECDENDHLNVRFYSRMVHEALASALAELNVDPHWTLRSQHMRYLAEARLATPITGFVAVIAVTGLRIRLATELRHTFSGIVLAAFLTDIETTRRVLPELVERPLPSHAGPRGLAMVDTPYAVLHRDQAREHGFHVIAKGCINEQECDARRELPAYALMGRMSDGMPNLWSVLHTEAEQALRANGFQGGAVLEYRMHHHRHLCAGDCYEVHSGVGRVTEKLQYFVHLCFDVASGRCVMSAEAVGVVLDLVARKSIPIPPERRERLLKMQILPL
jgi:acyl-CoA thioester hydrolase